MTDPEIRALVEKLLRFSTPMRGRSGAAMREAAAALTALVAERDEAREAYSLVTDCEPDVRERRAVNAAAIKEARRAAFARAKEIAERWPMGRVGISRAGHRRNPARKDSGDDT